MRLLPKVHPFLLFQYIIGGIIAGLLAIALGSCNSERRAVRQAVKIQSSHPQVLASACSSFYPPLDSVAERVVYKEGKPIVKQETKYVTVNCDSIAAANSKSQNPNTKYIRLPCPPCDSVRVDTVYKDRFQQVSDHAKEDLQAKMIEDKNDTIASQAISIKWWRLIAIILGAYTLARWIIGRYTRIKLP